MKIGILTFHWATNYGAILQSYALQEYLVRQGHVVEIINYKPSEYDYTLMRLLKHPSLWKNICREIYNRNREKKLSLFRDRYLYTTKRYKTVEDLGNNIDKYDVIISGSDQVFSPSFTLFGENGNHSLAYWLGFECKHAKCIGYSVSFGCEQYPEDASFYAKQCINKFEIIGTRENTGKLILDQLEYRGLKCVTPDPTILLGSNLYKHFNINVDAKKEGYTCVYMLRHEINIDGNIRYIDEKHTSLTMEQWLSTIAGATKMVTNSYHGMLMAIYAHVPFVVILETGSGQGMNDRFYTLLSMIGCEERMVNNVEDALEILDRPLNFEKIDNAIADFRKIGESFLKKVIGEKNYIDSDL